MIAATSIEFIKNLAQFDYDNQFYDFHNDFDCEKIIYSNGILVLAFKKLTDGSSLSLKFIDVLITTMDFFNMNEDGGLTLDNLYRGRTELHDKLIGSQEDKGYFHLEFYGGQKIEFWAKSLCIDLSN